MDWALGIFTIMAVLVTMIGIIIAARFVYIDNKYSEIIKAYERAAIASKMDEQNKSKEYNRLYYGLVIGRAQTRRKDNSSFISVDIACSLGIIIIGFITTFGVFESELILLHVILLLLFILPMTNFLYHLKMINKETTVIIDHHID